ncbi:MAG TPA: hypothetical protein VHH13_07500 [Arthrobacter sp.]|nr:hypothetical protein [Arthrobacter sp.]
MLFAIVMIVLVVAAVVWLLVVTRADRPAAQRLPGRSSDSGGAFPGAYGAGAFGGPGFNDSGSSSCDSGGGGA